ncbi:MAG: hypothetical protein ACH346_04550 [Chthoniobacterales bacterium]
MNNQSRSSSSIKNDHAQAEALLGFTWSLPDAFFKNMFSQSTEDCEELRRAGARSIEDLMYTQLLCAVAPCPSSASANVGQVI